MATLTLIEFSKEPTALDVSAQAVSAAVAGDEFSNLARVAFWVANSGGAAVTVTFDAANSCNFAVTHHAPVVVPDGFSGFIAHTFEASRFNDADSKVQATYSSVTGLTVAAVLLAT